MQDTVPAAEVRELLAAIVEALNPPDLGGSYSRHQELVCTRASYLTGLLRSAAAGGPVDPLLHAGFVREIATRFPARPGSDAS